SQEGTAMSIPGFTAEISTYKTISRFRSETTRSIGNGTKDNKVYMQKPNSENTPGGTCTGRISGVTISGTYDSNGRCCTYPPMDFHFASIVITLANAMIGI
ncbi:MAG: hypothetical protein ACREXR_22560, partial [Gammaproteobacteria bacterium]